MYAYVSSLCIFITIVLIYLLLVSTFLFLSLALILSFFFFFFFNDTAPTEIYTLSLHDALPILKVAFPFASAGCTPTRRIGRLRFRLPKGVAVGPAPVEESAMWTAFPGSAPRTDRKSTRLNSSH